MFGNIKCNFAIWNDKETVPPGLPAVVRNLLEGDSKELGGLFVREAILRRYPETQRLVSGLYVWLNNGTTESHCHGNPD